MDSFANVRGFLSAFLAFLHPFVIAYLALWGVYFALGFFVNKSIAQNVDISNWQPTLEAVRKSHRLPAIGVAIVDKSGMVNLATTGVRKQGEDVPVTNDDLWHIASNGKAMTATMIARLVERGAVQWHQTLGETFPERREKMSEAFRNVTVEHLLAHRAGVPPNFNLRAYWNEKDWRAAREKILDDAIALNIKTKPGEKFTYSNWSYTLAGAMAERATGKTFESLMREELFAPLGMKSAGFRGTGTIGKIDQPWPHAANGDPLEQNGPDSDNIGPMSPAGTFHLSLADWAKFVSEHLRGAKGESTFLKRETFATLHASRGDDYALGWAVAKREWANGLALRHNGDNVSNHAVVWAAPERGIAIMAVTNRSQQMKALDEAVSAILPAALKARDEKTK